MVFPGRRVALSPGIAAKQRVSQLSMRWFRDRPCFLLACFCHVGLEKAAPHRLTGSWWLSQSIALERAPACFDRLGEIWPTWQAVLEFPYVIAGWRTPAWRLLTQRNGYFSI